MLDPGLFAPASSFAHGLVYAPSLGPGAQESIDEKQT